MEITKEQLLKAYREMRTIREFEERIHVEFATGDIPGFVHLYAGEEAVAVGGLPLAISLSWSSGKRPKVAHCGWSKTFSRLPPMRRPWPPARLTYSSAMRSVFTISAEGHLSLGINTL